jgi:hypothetical protein
MSVEPAPLATLASIAEQDVVALDDLATASNDTGTLEAGTESASPPRAPIDAAPDTTAPPTIALQPQLPPTAVPTPTSTSPASPVRGPQPLLPLEPTRESPRATSSPTAPVESQAAAASQAITPSATPTSAPATAVPPTLNATPTTITASAPISTPSLPTVTPIPPTATQSLPTPLATPAATQAPEVEIAPGEGFCSDDGSIPFSESTCDDFRVTSSEAQPIPSNGSITQSGVYTGTRNCPGINEWSYCVRITASNVTLVDFTVNSNGTGIGVWANDVTIRNGTISSQNSSVQIWDSGDGFILDNLDVTITGDHSYVLIQDGDDANTCQNFSSKQIKNIAITNSDFRGGVGGDGIYVKCAENITIRSNYFKDSRFGTSLPDSINVLIENNEFDMVGTQRLGIELAKTHGAVVRNNLFYGDGPGGDDHAVSMNSGSISPEVLRNTWRNIRTGVDLGSIGALIEDNCIPFGIGTAIDQVLRVTEYDSSDPSETVTNNGPQACQ